MQYDWWHLNECGQPMYSHLAKCWPLGQYFMVLVHLILTDACYRIWFMTNAWKIRYMKAPTFFYCIIWVGFKSEGSTQLFIPAIWATVKFQVTDVIQGYTDIVTCYRQLTTDLMAVGICPEIQLERSADSGWKIRDVAPSPNFKMMAWLWGYDKVLFVGAPDELLVTG